MHEIAVNLTLEEVDFFDALLDDEIYRLEMLNQSENDTYPHIEALKQKIFNARLHLKHKSL